MYVKYRMGASHSTSEKITTIDSIVSQQPVVGQNVPNWTDNKFKIENDRLEIKLNDQAIVANNDSIIYMNGNIVVSPLKNIEAVAEEALPLVKPVGEALPSQEEPVSQPLPFQEEAASQPLPEKFIVGGDPLKINMVKIKSNGVGEINLSPPIVAEIEQIALKKEESINVINGAILGYTDGLTVSDISESVSNLYEYNEKSGLSFITIKNEKESIEYVWIYGFGSVEQHLINAGTTLKIPIEKLLAVKNDLKYSIEKDASNIWISFTGPVTIYTHSKAGISLYRNSKDALLEQLPDEKKDFPIPVPSAPPVASTLPGSEAEATKGGRRLFKNEKRQIERMNDPIMAYKDLMKFIG